MIYEDEEVVDFLERHVDAIENALLKKQLDELFEKLDLKSILEGRNDVLFFPVIDSIDLIDRPKADYPELSAKFKAIQALAAKTGIAFVTGAQR